MKEMKAHIAQALFASYRPVLSEFSRGMQAPAPLCAPDYDFALVCGYLPALSRVCYLL